MNGDRSDPNAHLVPDIHIDSNTYSNGITYSNTDTDRYAAIDTDRDRTCISTSVTTGWIG